MQVRLKGLAQGPQIGGVHGWGDGWEREMCESFWSGSRGSGPPWRGFGGSAPDAADSPLAMTDGCRVREGRESGLG